MTQENPEALNRYLDDLANGATPSDDDLDPDLLATVRWFRDLGAEPLPDQVLKSRLEHRIMNHLVLAPSAGLPAGTLDASVPGLERGRRSPAASLPERLPRWRWASVRLVAALLLVAAGLVYLVLGPLRDDPNGPRSIPAAVGPAATPGTPEVTPTATAYPMTGHAIIGMWRFDIETRQPETDLAYFDFAKDGTFVGSGTRGDWVAFGNWRPTGERTVELFYVLQGIPTQHVFAADYAPVGNVLEPGILTLHLTLQIDATRNTVNGEGDGTIYNEDGTVANTFNGGNARMIGVRMDLVQPQPTITPSS